MEINSLPKEQLFTQELYSYIEKQFHDNNALWGETAKKYSDASLKLFDDIIKFAYQMITAMGVVAGFGFIGIGGVKNIGPFVLGEGLILVGILVGMNNIRKIYISNDEAVEIDSENKRKVFEAKTMVLVRAMEDLVTKRKLRTRDFFQQLERANKAIGEEFGVGIEKKNIEDSPSNFMKLMIFLFGFGLLCLLVSFIPC